MNSSTAVNVAKPSALTGSRANLSKVQPGEENPPLDPQDVRQGRGGTRLLTILTVGIILAIGAFVVIGMFSETLLTTDVASMPGPNDAQEQLIRQ
jgi:uncharacterized protein YneF (UPF0154 family)